MTKSELKQLIAECIQEVAQEQQANGVEEGFFGDLGQFAKSKLPKKAQKFIDDQGKQWDKAKQTSAKNTVAGFNKKVATELDNLMARLMKDSRAAGLKDLEAKKIMLKGIEAFKERYNIQRKV
jgi:hypothetical protein